MCILFPCVAFDGPELQQQDPSPIITHDFKFGVKRKRRVHSLPSPPVSASSSHGKQHQQQQLQIHEIQEATYDSTDEVFNYECDPPTLNDVPEKGKRGEGNHLGTVVCVCVCVDSELTVPVAIVGYRYGKIPWNDADLALIITSASTPKLCLQVHCMYMYNNIFIEQRMLWDQCFFLFSKVSNVLLF